MKTKRKTSCALTKSIESSSTKKKGLEYLFGAWKDNRDSDLIIKEIRELRTNNSEIEKL